ncbi:PhoD-like phosphatase [Aeromicrobium marinum DSM 15272]|uniref:PhoD-like phosphatase n=1 Tax=Aeromicrobium marinum DSM 15272 TaxID=585531 RepID=E2SBA2_9ACTN|nr:PhoD-like phosphatase [Aeromicrobium marinum DSM 15272]
MLIGGMGLAAVAGVVGPAAIPSPAASFRHHRFQHGVASGDPLPGAVVIWTRVSPTLDARPGSGLGDPVEVTWEVSTDEDFTRIVRSGVVTTDVRSDHTVKIDVDGLLPGRSYLYRFVSGPDVSPVGRTRTAPAPGAIPARLRFGVVSCSNWQAGWFSAYRHLAERGDLDAVVHLGDYLYEYQPGKYTHGHDWDDVRHHEPPHETVTLADYRVRHAQYKTDPDLQALHAAVPFVVTWDDHEVADGWFPGGAFEHQPDEGSFEDRRWAAQRAYDEWMPVRLSGTAVAGDGADIHRHLQFGDLADLTMLDLRGHRDQRLEVDDPRTHAADRSLTGPAQHAWLVDTLRTSTARWKLVGNPVMIAPMLMPPRPSAEEIAVRRTTDPMAWGPAQPNTDTWDGYPADRRRLLEAIGADDVDGVVFLSGDVHTAWANEVEGADGRPVAAEFVCASVTSNNVDDFMGTSPRTVSLAMEEAIVTLNPHVRFVNLDDHGYCVLEVTPERLLMEWWAISDRTDPGAGTRRLAARALRPGSARILTV